MNSCIVFGGAGFIGQHFSRFLLENNLVEKVYLADIAKFDARVNLDDYVKSGRLLEVYCDVRSSIDLKVEGEVALIANFAAVHREPGHKISEYYETNLPGAEHVCSWAEKVGCSNIIFTSSIAPYGPTERPKTEKSIPTPVSGYGGSKLAAEKIHTAWQSRDVDSRRLVIVRPGVVYGPGEGGNVSRLIKAVLGGYFFFMGNKRTRKAGVYVKELCNAMWWVLSRDDAGIELFNMSLNPGPTMSEYVATIIETAGVKRFIPFVPFAILYPVSFIIDPFARFLGINQPISPVRLRKLVKSNNIVAARLEELNYSYKFSFKDSMADWLKDAPHEWSKSIDSKD